MRLVALPAALPLGIALAAAGCFVLPHAGRGQAPRVACQRLPARLPRRALADSEALTVLELRERLRERGLATSGRKGELIARLRGASDGQVVDVASSVGHLTVQQLRERLREHGLPPGGRKAELQQRLLRARRGQLPLSGSQLGRRFRGRVARKDRAGVYVDVGAGQDGLASAAWLSGAGCDGLEESLELDQARGGGEPPGGVVGGSWT